MLRELFVVICLFSVVHFGNSQSKNVDKPTDLIDWVYDVEEGVKLGEEQNKDMIIYFGSEACFPCKIVQKNIFTTEEFKAYSEKFVMVKMYGSFNKMNTEDRKKTMKYRNKYGVKRFPTMVLVKRNGETDTFLTYANKPKDLMTKIDSYYN